MSEFQSVMTNEELLKKYLSENEIIILDTVSSARVNVAGVLCRLGAVRNKMHLLGSIAEAQLLLQKTKIKVIFADIMIGNQSSFDLLQTQKKVFEKEKIKDSLFVLITSNASQSTVARAAEEDVDTFLIKPFAAQTLMGALNQTIRLKLFPNLYMRLIDEGKEQMFNGQLEAAIENFSKAVKEDPAPTLALAYYGQAEAMKKAYIEAENKYVSGLEYSKIHYKCLVGLFELLHKDKRYAEAYEVIEKLAAYFPANPKRLSEVLRLAIITNHYEDMEGYYRIFTKMNERSNELVTHMCSALLVTGKHYLRQKVRKRAVEVFNNAAISAGGRTKFLLYIVEALRDYKMKTESADFVSRLSKLAPGSPEHKAAQFLMNSIDGDKKEMMNLGRTLIREGIQVPSVYEHLILLNITGGFIEKAVELASEAIGKWPNKTKNFTYGFADDIKLQFG
jgi:tetratricopeptide (TPR) repeat protein